MLLRALGSGRMPSCEATPRHFLSARLSVIGSFVSPFQPFVCDICQFSNVVGGKEGVSAKKCLILCSFYSLFWQTERENNYKIKILTL